MWKQWVNAALGLATIVVPFVGLTAVTLGWTLGIIGLAVLAFSLWTISEVPREEYERVAHRHSHA